MSSYPYDYRQRYPWTTQWETASQYSQQPRQQTMGPTGPTQPQQSPSAGQGYSQTQSPSGGESQQFGQQAQQQRQSREELLPTYMPFVDVVESADELVVVVDAPGFDEDHFSIYADDYHLVVTAERSTDDDEDHQFYSRERPLRLQRVVQLPVLIDADSATAHCEDGMCEITIPKGDEEQRRQIGFQ